MSKKKYDLNLPELLAAAAYKRLKRRAKSIESAILEGMIEYILKFDVKDGILVDGQRNEEQIAALNRQLDKVLRKTNFKDHVKEYLIHFNTLQDWTIGTQKQFNNIAVPSKFLNPYKRRAINNIVADMMGEGLHQTVGAKLTKVLQDNVYYGGGVSDVIKALQKELLTVEGEGLGWFTSHVTTIGRDGLLQYHGNVNRVIINEYDLNAIRYVGSVVKNTRPQCRRWLKFNENGERGVILLSQLDEEIEWAKRRGSGFIKTTTVENFCKNRGGHGCRHTAIPIRF